MNKAEFKEKRKKLLEQRVRPTEGTEAVSAWDYDFNDSNEVLQSGEVELLENMTPIVPEDRPKTSEIFKEKRNKARHKLDAPILSEQLSDYPGSLNARDAVPPMVLMMDDVPDDVQKSTLSDPVSLPTPEPAIKKVSKAQSLVEVAEEAKKHVHIISYGNTLYYYNNYYYTQLDAKQLIKLYRKYVDYELNHESSLHGYKELYGCFMTDPQIECSEPEDEPIYDSSFEIDRMTWNGETMNLLKQNEVLSEIGDSYCKDHGIASSNAIDNALNDVPGAVSDPESVTEEPVTASVNEVYAESNESAALMEEIMTAAREYYENDVLPESERTRFQSLDKNELAIAWQDAMYTDIYECTSQADYVRAWNRFVNYICFYAHIDGDTDKVSGYSDYYDVYMNGPVYAETDDEAEPYVDEVLKIAANNGAQIQF